jgi:hypothetical protein
VRVTAVVLVLVTERRTVVRELVRVVAALVGAGVAVATTAGWRGAFDACRFSLAKMVMPPKLLKVIAAASTRSAAVEAISGLRRVRVAIVNRGTSARGRRMKGG